jgi:ribosomal subunit interface protein
MATNNVTVSGRNMDVGEALAEYVQTRLHVLSEKYFGFLVTCRVVFSKLKTHSFACHIQVVVGSDLHYMGEAEASSVYRCFNEAHEHVAKQLRRKKRALHEDKPNDHMKERVLLELSQPDPLPLDIMPMAGDELSIVDAGPETCGQVVAKLYGVPV